MRSSSIIGVSSILAAISAGAMVAAVSSLPDRPAGFTIDYPGFIVHSPAPSAPAFLFTDLDGAELSLASFEGKVLLVNLWATWCPPCVHEMPSLDRLQRNLGGDDFEVVALSIDREGADVVAPFFQNHGLDHMTIYLDPNALSARAFNARGFPTSYLLDAEGRHVATYEGDLDWDKQEIADIVTALIGK